jgi:type IV secretion system protein VirB10
VLRVILLTSVSTQLPGDAVGHLTDDVYGLDGSLVLPKGTRFIGSYANRVALGDNRLALAWDRVQLPGGTSFKVPGLPSTSSDGAAGLPGSVNNHTALVFGRAALLSLIGAGAQLGQPRQSRLGATLSASEVTAGSASQQLSQAGTAYLNRAIDVTPTLTVPAGTELSVLVPYDLDLR